LPKCRVGIRIFPIGSLLVTISSDSLKSIPYFAGLSAAEIDSISGLTFEKSFGKREMITWEGDPGEAIYFVISGAVKCFKTSPEGKEQVLQIVLPGNSFNDVAVFDGGPSPTSTEAMSPVKLYGITKNDMAKIMEDYPKLLPNVVKVLTARIRHILELVEDLSFRRVINRIARVLLEYASDGPSPKPRLTQQDMASIVGTAREVVGRSLKTLEGEGLIRMERNKLVITDKRGLEQIASAVD
jgi:CRP-like cAMP-binding protein